MAHLDFEKSLVEPERRFRDLKSVSDLDDEDGIMQQLSLTTT